MELNGEYPRFIDLDKVAWTTREGKQILVKDLEKSHLQNIINMLKRSIKGVEDNIQKIDNYKAEDIHPMASDTLDVEVDDLHDKWFTLLFWLDIMQSEQGRRKEKQFYLDPPL